MRNYDENDFLAKALLIFFAMYTVITGGYILSIENVRYSSPTYDLMAGLFSLDTYGVILIGIGALFIYATINEGKRRSWSLLIGGILGGVLFSLYATAAFEGTDSIMFPLRYSVIAGFNFIIAGVGGIGIWIRNT